jgi:hypothetical protein
VIARGRFGWLPRSAAKTRSQDATRLTYQLSLRGLESFHRDANSWATRQTTAEQEPGKDRFAATCWLSSRLGQKLDLVRRINSGAGSESQRRERMHHWVVGSSGSKNTRGLVNGRKSVEEFHRGNGGQISGARQQEAARLVTSCQRPGVYTRPPLLTDMVAVTLNQWLCSVMQAAHTHAS